MKKYNDEKIDFIKSIIGDCYSIADVCRKVGIRPDGSNYKTLNKIFKKYEINISHFIGQGWNRGEKYTNPNKIIPLEEILVKNSTYTNTSLLRIKLINNGIKEKKCENCKLEKWLDKDISLHLHHIDGDNSNNEISNLMILCPNCHSQTENYGSKNTNIKKNKIQNLIISNDDKQIKKINNTCSCGKEIDKRSIRCKGCENKRRKEEIKNRPIKEQLLEDIKNLGYSGTGRKYNVSDNCIRKWIK